MSEHKLKKRKKAIAWFAGLGPASKLGVGAAALAVAGTVGLGGAAAVAAWASSHQVTASVQAADPGYQLSVDQTTWAPGNLDISALVGTLQPGANISIPVYAKNVSTSPNLDEKIVDGTISTTGPLFDSTLADPASVVWDASPVNKTLPKAGTPVLIGTLKVTTDSAWPDTYRGKTGSVSVTISAGQ